MNAPLPLATADLDRLAKLLGLLGSDQDGERAAAAAKADELIRERGCTWAGLVEQLKVAQADDDPAIPHRRDANKCLASGVSWTFVQRDFLTNMKWRRRVPTPEQAKWLADLLDLARASGRA